MRNTRQQPRGRLAGWRVALRARSVLLLLALVSACGTVPPEMDEGKRLIAEGRYDEGLAKLEKAARQYPQNAEVRNSYIMQREAIVGAFVRDADALRQMGDLDMAEGGYRRALNLDPSSPMARTGLDAVARDRRLATQARDAEAALQRGDLATAESLARAVLAENSSQRAARAVMRSITERKAGAGVEPTLKVDPQLKVSLEFRDAPIQSVFDLISRRAGINFVFDREVRPDLRTTLVARETPLDDLIKLLLVTNQLERKVINESSVLIYPNTPAKKREYQEMIVRSFYLANADPKQTAAMIRTLVKTRDLFVDDKLNLIVMKDTPEAVRLAEQLVVTQDLGEPEVMLDLEVLEVASSVLQEFGIKYPDRINFGVLGVGQQQDVSVTGTSTVITTNPGVPPDLIRLNPDQWRGYVANPALVLNLRKLDGTVSLLANPRIRVKNRDKAKIHIGEKVPVITTTSTANVGVSSSVSYLETGLKLDVEPNVFLEDEVAIKVQLEVSNILEQLNVSGTVAYRLGTRNAATTLRLRDGETQVLAGLINSEDRKSAAKVPYISEVPLLGRLFRSDNDQRTKTEIVLLITPHVVRNLARPETVSAQFASGTDGAPGSPPLRVGNKGPAIGLAAGSTATAAAATAPTAAAQRQAAAAPRNTTAQNEAVPLLVTGPQQVSVGQEFALNLRFSGEVQQSANAYVDLSYDPAVLSLAGGAAPAAGAASAGGQEGGAVSGGGRTRVNVVTTGIGGVEPTPAEVRFRVIAKERTSSEIGIQIGSAIDFSGKPVKIIAPPAHNIEIVP